MRGRKPTPTMLAELRGNPNHGRKKNHAEPKPVGDLIDAPAWLSEDQKEGWRYALRNAPPGLLKLIDRGALAVWVVAEDIHRRASEGEQKTGLLVKGKDGLPDPSPFLPIINKQAQIMLKAASELGFTPVSRPRIFAAPTPGAGMPLPSTPVEPGAPTRSFDDFLADDAPLH